MDYGDESDDEPMSTEMLEDIRVGSQYHPDVNRRDTRYVHRSRHVFMVLPIKDLINEDGEPTTPFRLSTGAKPSVSHLHVLFFLCVVRKATAHTNKKALDMRHQAKKGFRGIFVGIPQHQKGYIVYVPSTRNIISSYDVVFDKSFLVS